MILPSANPVLAQLGAGRRSAMQERYGEIGLGECWLQRFKLLMSDPQDTSLFPIPSTTYDSVKTASDGRPKCFLRLIRSYDNVLENYVAPDDPYYNGTGSGYTLTEYTRWQGIESTSDHYVGGDYSYSLDWIFDRDIIKDAWYIDMNSDVAVIVRHEYEVKFIQSYDPKVYGGRYYRKDQWEWANGYTGTQVIDRAYQLYQAARLMNGVWTLNDAEEIVAASSLWGAALPIPRVYSEPCWGFGIAQRLDDPPYSFGNPYERYGFFGARAQITGNPWSKKEIPIKWEDGSGDVASETTSAQPDVTPGTIIRFEPGYRGEPRTRVQRTATPATSA